MENIQQIREDIEALEALQADPTIEQEVRDKVTTNLAGLRSRLAKAEAEQAQQAAPAPEPPAIPQPGQQTGDALTEALAVLRTMMLSAPSGSGVNSAEVNKLIEGYLRDKKVNLAQLDSSVLEEIKKNQRVVIEVPSINLSVEVSSEDMKIPNLMTMIDDVLAGNNIYLIGDAGGGKTYSAERIAAILKREMLIINCSQYTSPTEIIGGQTIEGYKEGKLIRCWRDGKMLLLDEMPRLDPNTAGLFNDALAKSSHTRPAEVSKINSSNPEEPPYERNDNFALIATGNVYPNTAPVQQYMANNQQDLSLLDRFSGSVYFVEYAPLIDQSSCRYGFIYDMLVGNYYEYMEAKRKNNTPPAARGLRTVLKDLNHNDKAVVSYRTCVAFRVAFEMELVRALKRKQDPSAPVFDGKTLVKAWNSYLVAFSKDVQDAIVSATKMTDSFVQLQVDKAIKSIENGGQDFISTLVPSLQADADKILKSTERIRLADSVFVS
jgi:cobaltochelatase CobS